MRHAALVFAFFASAMPLPAAALDCDAAATQAEMNSCAGERYKQTDKRLNETYATVMAHLSGNEEARQRLRVAQRAWVAFRDAQCDFLTTDSEEGSIYPALLAGCLTDATERRTEELKDIVNCQEGDLTCPRP